MLALKVENLHKSYEKFHLNNVSFELEQGYIMGFIGSNGAGKTTTLKSILNMIHTDSGQVSIFEKNFIQNEMELKQDIGYAFGEVEFYLRSKIKDVTKVVKRFYSNWNHETYEIYLRKFNLDPTKRLKELSQGMRVKYALTLALSHEAKLLILDEPTSGLDPVARDNLLEIFQELVETGERSILFSTHITSDLEKCADFITYINEGEIIGSDSFEEFINKYRMVGGKKEMMNEVTHQLISYKENAFGFTGLCFSDQDIDERLEVAKPSLEDIMIFYSRKDEVNV